MFQFQMTIEVLNLVKLFMELNHYSLLRISTTNVWSNDIYLLKYDVIVTMILISFKRIGVDCIIVYASCFVCCGVECRSAHVIKER